MRRRTFVVAGICCMLLAVMVAVVLVRFEREGAGSLATGIGATTRDTIPATSGTPTSTVGTGPTTTTTTATATTTTTTAPPREITIAATGDLLIHSAVAHRALANGGGDVYDFDPMLAPIAPLISEADLAICHMETPLSADNSVVSGYPIFNAPLELAADLAEAGYDTCSTASNHSLDEGLAGIEATLGHLDAAGLAHAGTARSAGEASTPTVVDAGGVAVGHLSYAYGFNGIPVPADAPWAVNAIDATRILEDAAKLRDAGSEVTVVSLQWGDEYQRQPSAGQRSLARELLGSPDVDVIIGHHVHVVQPIERIGHEYVVYGTGNLLSNQSAEAGMPAATQDGVIVHLTITEHEPGSFRVTDVTYTPTHVEHPTYRIVPADPATHPASYRRTVEAVTLLGPEAFDGRPTR